MRAWRPGVAGIEEVFHARFVDHAYPLHTHDRWAVIVIDDGGIRFDLDRHHLGATGATIAVLPPHVAHDGRSSSPAGFRKRVLYVDETVLPEDRIGRAVDAPTVDDPALRTGLDGLHRALATPAADGLELETRLALVGERLRHHLGSVPAAPSPGAAVAAERLRDLIDADPTAKLALADTARALGTNVTHLVRAFGHRFGLPPHRYRLGRRTDVARRLLLDGLAPADVAVASGFCDQAHLTRHFRRHVGTTPAAYARSGRPAA
ncbi:AraC family transcriptional regulator [Iamia sp. SCSIO 61187]|nr:AraC family transcriptional regulator [Iamia sp. SCSIO 61187]